MSEIDKGALEKALRHAITTASNDDYSKAGTPERARHVARINAMTNAADALAAQSQEADGMPGSFTVDDLAQEIRRVDGQHKLGAGALAEALAPFLAKAFAAKEAEIREVRMQALSDEGQLREMHDHIAHADAYQKAAMDNLARAEAAEARATAAEERLREAVAAETERCAKIADFHTTSKVVGTWAPEGAVQFVAANIAADIRGKGV